MQSLRFITRNSRVPGGSGNRAGAIRPLGGFSPRRGIAISIDALLAMIIFVSLLAFLGAQPLQETQLAVPKINSNQIIGDIVTALDNTGFVIKAIEESPDTTALKSAIEGKVDGLLPENVEYKLELNRYDTTLSDECRAQKTFAACFPTNPIVLFSSDLNAPPDREVFHGKKIFLKKEAGECSFAAALAAKKQPKLYLQGNSAPEARDVNITASDSCPSTRNPCPAATDTMRCCYRYYDQESDPQAGVEYKWYKFDSGAPGDHWVFTGQTGQTVSGLAEGERWQCSASVNDGSQWSRETKSVLAIIGGPCFSFSSAMQPTPLTCDVPSAVSITLKAEKGGRRNPVDIMLTMDRSGSMSWTGRYQGSGTERDAFVDNSENTAYLSTSSYVYKMLFDPITGNLAENGSTSIDDARGIYVDGGYVFAADYTSGLTAINKNTMVKAAAITNMTPAVDVFVQGDYAYVAASGNPKTANYDVSMTASQDGYESVGYDSDNNSAAQSFKPSVGGIDGVRLELYRAGNSPGNLIVHLRSTANGADLPNGTVTVSAGSIARNNYNWYSIDFPAAVSVTAGQTYYITLTTTTLSTGNYYRWGSAMPASGNPYINGSIYRCSAAGACTAQEPPNQADYEDARFRTYYYTDISSGLVIVNKSDQNPANWFIQGSLYDTGSGLIDDPTGVFVAGDYAYITDGPGGDSYDGLWIVDVSNRSAPAKAGFANTTDAQAVSVSGNYAYVADGSGGLRVVDVQDKSAPTIPKTVGGLGTNAKDVSVLDTNAYVIADTGVGATSDGLHVIDISAPLNAYKITTFDSPYDFYRLSVGGTYAFIAMSYGLMTVNRFLGPKINYSRSGAKEFVSYPDWRSPDDQLGIVSYASDANEDSRLLTATDANKETMRTKIGWIKANGSTFMATGIKYAIDEILPPGSGTGGHGRTNSIRFIILLADGQSDESQSAIDTQVARARSNQIYIFAIGLGGDVVGAQMQGIASGAYCPNPAEGDCGSYHHISDPAALSEIYAIISQQISMISGILPDVDATDITMELPGLAGLGLSNFNPAPTFWDGTTLRYDGINIVASAWTGAFDVTVPCDYAGCSTEFVEGTTLQFPPENSQVNFKLDGGEQLPVEWPDKFSVTTVLFYGDLLPEFLDGNIFGEDDILLHYLVSNNGYLDIDLGQITPPTVAFRYNDQSPDNPLVACEGGVVGEQQLAGILEAAFGNGGTETSADASKALPQQGYICISLNENGGVHECRENNRVVVWCKLPETRLYVLDYWAWEK